VDREVRSRAIGCELATEARAYPFLVEAPAEEREDAAVVVRNPAAYSLKD
jgi:hypothetical protein